MSSIQDDMQKKVIQANIEYHTKLAPSYNQTQPHYFPENVERVESIIADLAYKTSGGSLLDLGCGTGFIVHIARRYFRRVVGIDITSAMLDQVDISSGNVELYLAQTEDLSFLESNSFDVCTAYGFLHHLYDLNPTLREAYRCLRSGGYFYSDQDPNMHYWKLMYSLRDHPDLRGFVAREVHSVVEMVDSLNSIDLEAVTIELAEYHKGERGGLNPDTMISLLKEIGFKSISVRYEWFLGQGKFLQRQSLDEVKIIEAFLRESLPATRAYFKYLAFYAQK